MEIPAELRYTSDHEWARLEEGNVRVGITDFAQSALGDVVFVELPVVGTVVETGASLGEVESTKSVSEIYAPIAGRVLEVNTGLEEAPQQMNEDPYGKGWLCLIAPGDSAELEGLLSHEQYLAVDRRLIRGELPAGRAVGGTTTVSWVFCHNCGHRNPAGVNFCSSCGAALLVGSDTTVSFVPDDPSGDIGEEELGVALRDVLVGTGVLVVKRGPDAGAKYPLKHEVTRVGRHPESDIFLDDITVSWRHAEFVREDRSYLLRDVGSLNGTYVNRERIDDAHLGGDEVQIGKFKLVFLAAQPG